MNRPHPADAERRRLTYSLLPFSAYLGESPSPQRGEGLIVYVAFDQPMRALASAVKVARASVTSVPVPMACRVSAHMVRASVQPVMTL